jgi:hypothetical protein
LYAVSCLLLAAGTPGSAADGEFTRSQVCATCHAGIYASYRQTDMGRSMALPSDASQRAIVSDSGTVTSPKLNRGYSVFRKGGALYQSEYELDSSGHEVFRDTHKLEYAIGSGVNGITYLVRQGEYLFEAPLTYYTRIHQWGLSPGYETEDLGFSRPAPAACVSCHSGRSTADRNRRGLFRDPPFQELAIGCENCHGPGQRHVAERRGLKTASNRAGKTIVNPAKIEGWLADNICMNCHEGTATRVLQPGKEFSDFRPGRPLDETVAVFAPPLKPGATDVSPLLEHYTLMTLSTCYRASKGALHCVSCHDPHVQPRSAPAAYYRQKCLQCHTAANCKLPLDARKAKQDDCAGCHMPKDRSEIPHSVLTDHRIVVTKDQPLPEEAFHRTTAALPDLVHISAIPGKQDKIAPLTLMRAYGELATTNPQFGRSYSALVDELARTNANDYQVLSALGWREFGVGTPESYGKAMTYLSRATEAGSVAPLDYEKLADLLRQAGRTAEAIETLKKGIGLSPYSQRLYKALALVYIGEKRYPEAIAAMEKELEVFPEDSLIRTLVVRAKAASSR